jgi:myo-inositol-1(or 4)-monophosphatase
LQKRGADEGRRRPEAPPERANQDCSLRDLSLRAARAGAEAIREVVRYGAVEAVFKDGTVGDPVTVADHASERAIRAVIARHRPHDAVLAEESGLTPGTSGLRWVIDPLDGTLNFSHGHSRYAVSVAVVADPSPGEALGGHVLAATILRPATGGGLWLDGAHVVCGTPGRPAAAVKAAVNTAVRADRALVAFAVPNVPHRRHAAYRALAQIAARLGDLRNSGSTVCDLAAVTTGRFDAFLTFDPAPWDIAAGLALVQAAGGTSRRWRHDGGVVVAAGAPPVVAALREWLAGQPAHRTEENGD